jgi:hypothetical protein
MLLNRFPAHQAFTIKNNQVEIPIPQHYCRRVDMKDGAEDFGYLEGVLEGNRGWAKGMMEKEPGFFEETTKGQVRRRGGQRPDADVWEP